MVKIKEQTTSTATISKVTHLKSLLNTVLNQSQNFIELGMVYEAFKLVCLNTSKLYSQNELLPNEQAELKAHILSHKITKYFHLDPLTKHSFDKPFGYSGDATLLDFIYRIKGTNLGNSFIGRELYSVSVQATPCDSVRWRAQHLAEKIESISKEIGKPINALSIASGKLRELAYISDFESQINQFDCLDQDTMSNAEVRKNYASKNVNVMDESIKYVLTNKLQANHYDFVYSAGLFDYLDDKVAKRMIAKMYEAVKPGGKMLVPNFTPGMLEQGYMETFMDWYLIYRNEAQMIELTEEIQEFINPEDIKLYRDPNCNVVYLEITKK